MTSCSVPQISAQTDGRCGAPSSGPNPGSATRAKAYVAATWPIERKDRRRGRRNQRCVTAHTAGGHMRPSLRAALITVALLTGSATVASAQAADPATREQIDRLLELTGSRVMSTQMASLVS